MRYGLRLWILVMLSTCVVLLRHRSSWIDCLVYKERPQVQTKTHQWSKATQLRQLLTCWIDKLAQSNLCQVHHLITLVKESAYQRECVPR